MANPHPEGPPLENRARTFLWLTVAVMVALGIPGMVLRLSGTHPAPVVGAVIFGTGILAAAFLLSWAAETAEMDVSQGLALAVVAIIAVLPEYAVDMVLAWQAADPTSDSAREGLAIANMTGGNRLLIGFGWPVVFAIFFLRSRIGDLLMDKNRSLELAFLMVATLYVIFIPLRHSVSLVDTIVLVTLFGIYMLYVSRLETEPVELVGPARAMGALDTLPRRIIVTVIVLFAAATIFLVAEPFADSLVAIGEDFGVSKFFLIQWLAPLASESPEILVAGLLAWRLRAGAGMGVLISSKVNQWTLLIGTLPIAFLVSAGEFSLTSGLPLDDRQREEIFLTAAQSVFAIAVFVNLRMGHREALALFVLFATQLFITNESARLVYAAAYTALAVGILVVQRASLFETARNAFAIIRGRELEHLPASDTS
jgi:cation:H+ antiporter